ncbi:(2Fe-2S)-binding protein [Natrinema sp. CBA1119]|uniref:Rieske (2Fe-2S) protein n=1 Tax=Natrinema sp. CBA1119 TaxID=1608465 RepID=UPI000BF3CDB3|nr:Rieske 2Fe-2S domain-containing protein [Natrinema sp. CBA1119]PGF16276.1 (2Fe-2S)-binding protein [Natrinema sp. CBA1119]
MSDPVRVTLEGRDESTSVRVYDDEGDVSTDDATFRFSVDGGSDGGSSGDEPDATDGADETDGIAPGRSATASDGPRRIAPLAAVPTNGTLRCEARAGNQGTELILRRTGDEVSAWRNSCPHRPTVRLDPGPGAIVRDDQLVCHEHGARFECGDGVCTAGPCRGATLDAVAVTVRDETVYLTDDRFDSCRRLDEPVA